MDIFADLTFWQMVLVALIALPVIAIVLIAAIAVIGIILWWTIKIVFFGAILLVVVMIMVALARMFGAA